MTLADAPPQPFLTAAPPSGPYERLDALASRFKTGQVQIAEICSYCEVLVGLGLTRAVEAFLDAVKVSHPEWQAHQQAIRARIKATSANGGLISWSSRQRRFKANLAILAERWPEYEVLFANCEADAQRYQLHQANDWGGGNYQLRDTVDPNPLDGWSGGLKDQKGVTSLWTFQRTEPELVSPVAFDGVGFGWLLLRVLETTRNTYLNYSPAVYVVESDPLAIWMLLHLHDLREWLAHPRLQLFLGEDAAGKYREFLATGRHTLPNYCYGNLLTQRPRADLVAIAARELQNRKERAKELREQVERMYAGRTADWWEQRFDEALAGRRPLKIMGITSRFTTVLRYSMEELAHAVRAAGHEFYLSMEADDSTLERTDLKLIDEVQPDLLILLSRMRCENAMLPTCIPFLCWDQDYLPVMRTPEVKASLDDLTYVAGYAANYGYHEQGWPARNCIFCHLAAATHRYSDEAVPEELRRQYACDFSYVSNAWESPRDYARQIGRTFEGTVPPRVWEELAEHAIAGETVNGDVAYWNKFIEGAAERNGYRAPANVSEIGFQLVKLADRCFRHEALGWVAEYCRNTGRRLKLYGNGWENNADFAAFASGPIEPGLSLRALYQATAINLQLILGGFLHARSLDGIAAGGFFLTRHSASDYYLDPNAADIYAFSRRAAELGIWNFQQLRDSNDPLIRAKHDRWVPHPVSDQKVEYFSAFLVANALAAASFAFPEIPDISFRSAEEFSIVATKYLADPALRESTRRGMRKTVQQRFSYDARLKTFLESMTRGFTQRCGT